MSRFISTPNLPQSRVNTVLISSKYEHIIKEVEKLGIECIKVKPLKNLDTPVNCHPDMILHHLGGKDILLFDYDENLNQTLRQKGFNLIFCESKIKKEYPYDIPLNCLNINGYIFGKRDFIDNKIKSRFNLEKIINTKQGYAKCSCCVVDKTHIITTDKSLEKVLKQNGFEVLFVNAKSIMLEGYNNGFIGGCCGLIDKDKLLFSGVLSQEYQDIRLFCKQCGVEVISLPFDTLNDIGSIIPILQD